MPIPHVRRIPCIRYCGCSEEKHQTRFSWLGYLFPWFEQSCLGTMSNLIFLYQLPHCYSTNVAWNHASLDLWSESVEQPEMNKASISSTRLTLRSVVLRIFLGGKGLLRTTRACVRATSRHFALGVKEIATPWAQHLKHAPSPDTSKMICFLQSCLMANFFANPECAGKV